MTFREESTAVDRNLFQSYFRYILSSVGQPVAAYFPSDGSPLFVIDKKDEGWFASSSVGYRNKVLLNGVELNSTAREIRDNIKLEIVSHTEGSIVGSFEFRFR